MQLSSDPVRSIHNPLCTRLSSTYVGFGSRPPIIHSAVGSTDPKQQQTVSSGHGAVRQGELLGRALHQRLGAVRLVPALRRPQGAAEPVCQKDGRDPHGRRGQLAPVGGDGERRLPEAHERGRVGDRGQADGRQVRGPRGAAAVAEDEHVLARLRRRDVRRRGGQGHDGLGALRRGLDGQRGQDVPGDPPRAQAQRRLLHRVVRRARQPAQLPREQGAAVEGDGAHGAQAHGERRAGLGGRRQRRALPLRVPEGRQDGVGATDGGARRP